MKNYTNTEFWEALKKQLAEEDILIRPIEEKRRKMEHMWMTVFLSILVTSLLVIVVAWVLRVEYLWDVISYALLAYVGLAMIVAIIFKVIDKYLLLKEEKLIEKYRELRSKQ